ncbi:hypothetical protein EK0264_17630 [Epidermidibacterium keratini]|uniref:Uncharacterized protein n=1 Tax=Epidermidibacterium keratini TaxID=1891644 RepID=A0A7L4YSN8_9ACTN|nr:hypothetical protein [Epidermidibacterium keratini]QHC01914.1 hypothetical protein EK0264_17630 [Epidermidibacterium keratini]
MSRNPFADPTAGALGGVAAIGSFFLIPGLAAAIPAALGIGALVYGGKVAISSLRGDDERPAIATAAPTDGPRPKRGSPAEVWSGRGEKALRAMNDLVASCDQPVIKEQVETTALGASDAKFVIAQLASQTAAVEQAIDAIGARPGADRERLVGALGDDSLPPQLQVENQRSLDAIDDQASSYDRLVEQRSGLLARLEATVRGLESLNSEIAEVIAIGRTSAVTPDWGGEQQIAELRDELAGLRAGLEESQRYSEQVLRSQYP